MSNLPATQKNELIPSAKIDWNDPKIIKVVRDTCAPTATQSEWEYFVLYCQSTGLNPLKREVWFIKTGGKRKPDGTVSAVKIQIMTGINGFFSIANDHGGFDGMSDPEYVFDKDGCPISCKIRAYRKDRSHPATGMAFMREYFQKGQYGPSMWETKPCHMLAKVAKSIALREAFPQQLGGMFTDDEMPPEFGMPQVIAQSQVETPTIQANTSGLSATAPRPTQAAPKARSIETAVLEDGTVVDNATGEILQGPTEAVQNVMAAFPGTTVSEPTEEGLFAYKLPWECPGYDMKEIRKAIDKNFKHVEGYQYIKDQYMYVVPQKLDKLSNFPFAEWEVDLDGKYIVERSQTRSDFFKWKKGGGSTPAPKPAVKKQEVSFEEDNISEIPF